VRSPTERSVYETASGRVLLAYLGEKELAAFVASVGLPAAGTWLGADTPEGLAAALAQIRADELLVTLSPSHIVGLAVPIWQQNRVVASLSLFPPQSRCPAARKKEITPALRQVARQIQEQLTS